MIKAAHFEIEEVFAICSYATTIIDNCQLWQIYVIFQL